MPTRLLLIEDQPLVLQDSVRPHLTLARGFLCQQQGWSSIDPYRLLPSDVELMVLAGSNKPEQPMRLFDWLRSHPIGKPTLAVLPQNAGDEVFRSAVETVDDFVVSPVREEELHCRVKRILGNSGAPSEEVLARQRLKQELGLTQFVGQDSGFAGIIKSIPDIAASSAPVLLLGETGTGKELCAQAIHSLSPRHPGPFIPVECGAIPENLAENELFGHIRGAFTDAHRDQKGLVTMADGGTLFLDEIDSLPLAVQAKLLRFLQEGTYRLLGSQKFCRSDVRLITASNRDLEQCVREGQLRADLYFRLNVLRMHLPPLRERRSDIAVLAHHFLQTLATAGERPARKISLGALRLLEAYDWPGNIRELYNVMQRAVAFCHESQVLPVHLGLSCIPEQPEEEKDFREARSRAIENFEKTYVQEMLRKNNGNVTRSALAAGKDRRVFGRLMKAYKINRRDYE